MFKKIKEWNWPVIWSVLSPALIAVLWLFIGSLFSGVMNLPQFEAIRNAPEMSDATLYGVCSVLYIGCLAIAISRIVKFFKLSFNLLRYELKKK